MKTWNYAGELRWPSKHSRFSKKWQHRDWQYYGPLRTWPAGSWNIKPVKKELKNPTTAELLGLKEDSRPPRGGWAPGRYLNHCLQCGHGFVGDKRATYCADCAYAFGPTPANKAGA